MAVERIDVGSDLLPCRMFCEKGLLGDFHHQPPHFPLMAEARTNVGNNSPCMLIEEKIIEDFHYLCCDSSAKNQCYGV